MSKKKKAENELEIQGEKEITITEPPFLLLGLKKK